MTKKIDLTRREFIKNASFLSAAGSVAAPFALNLFSMRSAMAASGLSGYKALVCLYLGGGNDHNNTVIATDATSWTGYNTARGNGIGGAATIAIPLANLAATTIVPSNPQARSFALHPELKKLTTMFNAGSTATGMKAAIIANVGTLIRPIHNLTDYHNYQKPMNLFSHSDQTSEWQSTAPLKLNYGWGGRMADIINTTYSGTNSKPNFSCISASGNTAFLAGETIHQYQISQNGAATAIQGFTNLFGAAVNSGQTLKDIIIPTTNSTNLFELDQAAVVQRALDAQTDLSNIMSTYPTSALPPLTQYQSPNSALGTLSNNSLAIQLQTIARIIAGRAITGANRQVFFVSMGGFDTHNTQVTGQADLMARIDHAIDYFNTTLVNLPGGDMSPNVTLFTASDFGRTLTSNGDGTDHGWGAHHFVVGGAVKGGDIYGPFPVTAADSSNPLNVGSGNTIPQISVDQYAGTLARWFGLGPTNDLPVLFPNLSNFSFASDSVGLGTDLGFI